MLHQRSTLFLAVPPYPPTPEALQERVASGVQEAWQASDYLGPLTLPEAFREAPEVTPSLRNDYARFADTLAVSGLANPELSRRLGRAAGVELLTTIMAAYLPCAVCEEGDQLWLVAQVVEAESGELLLRHHLREPDVPADEEALTDIGDDLLARYVDTLNNAARPKWHRQRFKHLRARQGAGPYAEEDGRGGASRQEG